MAESERTHIPVKAKRQQQVGNTLTRTEVNGHAGKDTGHSKRLGKGVEGASPGNLPGSDVNQDEMELQQELTHLKQHAVRDTLASRHTQITKHMAKPKKQMLKMSYLCFPQKHFHFRACAYFQVGITMSNEILYSSDYDTH